MMDAEGERTVQIYQMGGEPVDSIDLKAMVVSRGVKVSSRVYRAMAGKARLYADPVKCNCFLLPDGTVVQMTDLQLHLNYLRGALSWDSLKQMRYLGQMQTPFRLDLGAGDEPTLYYETDAVTTVSFPVPNDFYGQRTSSGLPFYGNAVIQGTQWLAFQCLWPCDYACAGKPCAFCYSGGIFENLARRGKTLPPIPTDEDVADMVKYALFRTKICDSLQLTGGSSFDSEREVARIRGYLAAIRRVSGGQLPGELLLYMTPPAERVRLDELFALGADRIACSLEVWDETLAQTITPGKWHFTGRQRHLDSLQYIADRYGRGHAFSNFIIGLEPFDSFAEGAQWLAERGILPSASIWIPFGSTLIGSVPRQGLPFYRQVKRHLAALYDRYDLEPAGGSGLNVCIERDVWLHRKEILGRDG